MLYIVIAVACFSILCYMLYFFHKNVKYSLHKEHFLITGGSSGIGLAIAIEAVLSGASVTLIARNQERLKSIQVVVQQCVQSPDQKVLIFAADVTEGVEPLEETVKKAEKEAGPITCLVNCAGASVSYRFEETPIEDFKKMLDLNYLGTVYMTRAVLPYMKSRRNGKIIFVSSLAGLVGLYGFTAYSASKFALVGMAQGLEMEVQPYGISVTVSFPPDTNTPGFAEEIKSKPLETRLLCENGGLFEASTVAKRTIKDAINKRFMSSVGFEGWLLCFLCSGMSPVYSVVELSLQVLTMSAFRVVCFIYRFGWRRMVKRCMKERDKDAKCQ